MNRKGILFLLLSFIAFVFAIGEFWFKNQDHDLNPKEANTLISKEVESLNSHLSNLKAYYSAGNAPAESIKLYAEREGIDFFVFDKQKLKFWTNESTIVQFDSLEIDQKLYRNSNATYLKIDLLKGDTLYLVLKEIYSTYNIQNEYLKSKKNKELIKALSIPNLDERFLLSDLEIQDERLLFLLLGAILSIVLGLIATIFMSKSYRNIIIPILGVLYTIIPIFLIAAYTNTTKGLASKITFLGLLEVSVIQLAFISLLGFLFSYSIIALLSSFRNSLFNYASVVISVITIYFSFKILEGIALSREIQLQLDNLFSLEIISYISLISFLLLLLSAFLWVYFSIRRNSNLEGESNLFRRAIIYSLLAAIIFIVLGEYYSLLIYLGYIAISYFSFKTGPKNNGGLLIITVLSISILTTIIIREKRQQIEHKQRKEQLIILSKVQDDKAEDLFVEVQKKIREDRLFLEKLTESSFRLSTYKDYLRGKYLNGYWESYSMTITLCDAKDSILTSEGFSNRSCVDFFNERLLREGDNVSANNFFRLSNLAGRIDYIGEISLSNNDIIYIELSRNNLVESLGYPNLLINKSGSDDIDLKDYSYAIYYKDELINRNGKFVYSTNNEVKLSTGQFEEYDTEKYNHISYRKDENTTLILSKQKDSLLQKISFFTYLLIVFGVITLILISLLRGFPLSPSFSLKDFSSKVQLLLVGSLFFSLVLFGLGSTYFIQQQYETKNAENIEEKLASINMELEQKIGVEETLPDDLQAYIQSLLIKFSNIFFTDINIYDLDGKLFATSRPELYLQKIRAKRMSYLAYSKLSKGQLSEWIQKENIGQFKYLSAYIPFKNQNNETIAYLNIPYYAKEKALEEEILAFLIPTINICLIVFTLALILLLIVNRQLTRPLTLIRSYFKKLRLGNEVELIKWNSKDEIGELVNEYNKIAIELSESANELAKNERELAWREMAKQVAHEIKNPLTPMKLSVQHLQQASKAKVSDLDERIKKTTETLVNQIDALSNIASAFSSFASLPTLNKSKVNLASPILDAYRLYENQAKIVFEKNIPTDEAFVTGDRDQLLSVFNNLIKNAVQAKDSNKETLIIRISLKEEGDYYKIEIEDNGIGISEEKGERIFEPSFTTKSSGSGLGLSISKRIIENMKGNIEFSSQLNVRTTFVVKLPKAKD